MVKVNITVSLRDEEQAYHFENFIRKEVEVKDFRILPDTTNLYDNDESFRKLLKAKKTIETQVFRYINDHNH